MAPKRGKFLIKWKNKLDIGDTNVQVLRNEQKGKLIKEIVIGYKTIFLNTYNVMLMDISEEKQNAIIFRHEGFQLWESASSGFLLDQSKDYVLLNNKGIQILALGSKS